MTMRLWITSSLLVSFAAATIACSGDAVTVGAPAYVASPDPSASVSDGGVAAPTKLPDGGTAPAPTGTTTPSKEAGPPQGSGGNGGPGPGVHAVTIAGRNVAVSVPSGSGPMPVMLLLHGQGDTGSNFLNVWIGKGLPKDMLLVAPDDNTDDGALAVESGVRAMFDVDTTREYALGFSQGGGYAAFFLFDPAAGNRFAAVALASSGLAQNPAGIPAATSASPAIAVVIDPEDPNNTWMQGKHVMEDFVTQMTGRGYDAQIWLHHEGHKLAVNETTQAVAWMRTFTK